jgi:hypothetical protein
MRRHHRRCGNDDQPIAWPTMSAIVTAFFPVLSGGLTIAPGARSQTTPDKKAPAHVSSTACARYVTSAIRRTQHLVDCGKTVTGLTREKGFHAKMPCSRPNLNPKLHCGRLNSETYRILLRNKKIPFCFERTPEVEFGERAGTSQSKRAPQREG